MKSGAFFPVTADNFSQCWESVDHLRRKGQRKAAVARIGGFLSMLFFLFLVLFLANGVIYDRMHGSYCVFLKGLPGFLPLWKMIRGFLLKAGSSPAEDLLRLALFAYGLSALVFCMLTGIITLLCHPKKKQVPEGAFTEVIAALEKAAEESRSYTYKSHISTSVVSVVIVISSAFLLFFAYTFQLQNAALITRALSRFPTGDAAVNCLLYVLAAYMVCEILGSVLLLITRPLYRFDFSLDYVTQIQTAALLAQETIPDAAELREKAIAEEKEGGYHSAKELFRKAALLGDLTAMEHYGRHCLLNHMPDSGRYWLNKSAAAGNNSPSLKKLRLRLKLRLHSNAAYLKPDEAPPSTGRKILTILRATTKLLWRILMLAVFALSIWILFLLFKSSTDPSYQLTVPDKVAGLVLRLQDSMNRLNSAADSYIPEDAVQKKGPVMTLTVEGTPWENNCVLYDEYHDPVVFCYGKDTGGDLSVPFYMEETQRLGSATVYTGNQWDLRSVIKHVSHMPQTQTLIIAEEYLMSLDPGEYCIILDKHTYIPVLVTEQSDFNTPQRGLAAQGNHSGWIVNDLENIQDITLPFYNLGSDTIVSVSESRQLFMLPKPTETELDSASCSVSPDGHSVTLHADYLRRQEPGSYFGLKLILSSGESLNISNPNIGTVQGTFDGLMQISGTETYSLSKDSDIVLNYTFGLEGTLMNLTVHSDSTQEILAENLSDFTSEYIDFDNQTITIPKKLLDGKLAEGENLHIGISYVTAFSQFAYGSRNIRVIR